MRIPAAIAFGLAVMLSASAAPAQYAQYPQYQQNGGAVAPGFGDAQVYRYNPAPAAPTSWSFDPYTSGLGPCPQRDRFDQRCSDTVAPTAGQPNYWSHCAPGSAVPPGGGPQADAECQQIAIRQVYQYADAQQTAIAAQVAPLAATRTGVLTLPASAYQPVSADYQTPSNGHRHRITVKRLNSYSEPAIRRVCDTFTRIEADLTSGTSATSTAQRCKGPDGQWHDA